ncbi:antiviral reverse transcriptase Drt3a [Rhodohalobacter sp. 614A]|uniref:antiviral reverse transcriptase Drt3a n=1 Tax=Rhodohalobacter sp. 614A TaxID=2908649 RepID=UPI001F36CAE1|nr:antiviral reverse transcriptase Drt3a [Rhodohalobacter sp. 614A]
MLDQSFSAKNFRTILDIENRKGVHLEDKLSMTKVRKINESIRDCNKDIRDAKKGKISLDVNKLYEKKKSLRKKKELELEAELENISKQVTTKGFRIQLNKVTIPSKKPLYVTKNSPKFYFALKQLQRNISKLYGVKQSNRFNIISQLKIILDDKFPKFVIKTDLKNFYESIPHDRLLRIINEDNLLTPFSRNLLINLLNEYKRLSGNVKGIPRGIGVSAYLAELYMRDIDEEIKNLSGVSYYSRFVDDIVIVFTPTPTEISREYLKEVRNIVESQKYNLKLSPSSEKTDTFDLRYSKADCEMEYLGYKIRFGENELRTYLTDKKIEKYKSRLKLAFDHYKNLSKVDEKNARKILVKRIRYITGNTKLSNNKKNILVGIYYSNSQLTELDGLERLDLSLNAHIRSKVKNNRAIKRLSKYSFKKGFLNKRFSPFTPKDLKEIKSIW